MAEPARKLPEDSRPDIRPHLSALEGGGQGSAPHRGHLSSVPEEPATDARGFYQDDEAADAPRLQALEGGGESSEPRRGHLNSVSDGDTSSAGKQDTSSDSTTESNSTGKQSGKFKRFTSKLKDRRNQKKAGIAALAGGGIAGLAVGGFLMLAPLKVLHIMTNLQNEFFAASDLAGGKMGDRLIGHYLVRKVIPGMATSTTCNSTRADRSCASVGDNQTPLGLLFTAWRDNNLEGKLFRNHGIEIARAGNNYYMRAPGLGEIDLGNRTNVRDFEGRAFTQLNRSEVRQVMRTAFETESFSKRMRYKFSVGKLLERKYGIRRCIVACKTRDKVNDAIDLRRTAFKMYLTERYIMPRSEMMGLALNCALAEFDCTSDRETNNAGENQTKFQRDLRAHLIDFRSRAQVGDRSLADLKEETDRVKRFGVTGYIVRRIAGEAVGSVAGKIAGKFIPIAGQIDAVSTIYEGAQNAGPAVKHMNYAMNVASAVAMAGVFFTNADEQKTGLVDGTTQGSIAAAFDEVPGGDQGGGAMEATPLYDSLMNGGTGQTQTASVFNLFSPKAYAQEETPEVTAYTCADGKLVPNGALVCPEMGFSALSTAAQIAVRISEVANNPALSPVSFLSAAWQSTFGLVFDGVEWLIGKAAEAVIPDAVMEETIEWIQEHVMKPFFIDQLGELPSGGRIFEIAALGTNQMGNDTAQFVQGGRVLSPEEESAVKMAMRSERLEAFQAKPFYARLFDKSDSSSLVSRVALKVPSNATSMARAVGSFIGNPLDSISRSFSAVFTTPEAKALNVISPFGLPTYGYPINHPVFAPGLDVEQYWTDNNCDNPDNVKEWGEKATEMNEDIYVPLQREVNPCMLIRSAIADGGGAFDSSLLLKDPDAAEAVTDTGITPGTGDTALPVGDTVSLAKQLGMHPNVSFQTRGGEMAFGQIQTTGRATSCGAPTVSPKLLGVLLKLADSYKLVLGVLVDGHSCDGGQHPAGTAVDLNGVNPINGGTGTGSRIGDPEPSGPNDPYPSEEQAILKEFYALGGQILSANGGGALGQHQCFTGGAAARSPNVVYFGGDSCNHIHLDAR